MATAIGEPTSGGPGEAGWKAHPEAPGWEVYWDGSAWTSNTRRIAPGDVGTGTYTYEIATSCAPDDVPREWLPILTDVLSQAGYSLDAQVLGSATYNRRYSPLLFVMAYIFVFPAGLLLLSARPVQTLSATWSGRPGAERSSIRIVSPDRRLLPLFDRIEGSRRIA